MDAVLLPLLHFVSSSTVSLRNGSISSFIFRDGLFHIYVDMRPVAPFGADLTDVPYVLDPCEKVPDLVEFPIGRVIDEG